ncbi:MAG: hypothetical protein Q4C70_02150 [Planctomycetia bacterium]|nr:hypothetical protein [Planctomycetia bacterium]
MKRRTVFQVLNLFLGFATLGTSLFAQNLNPVATISVKDIDTLAENLPAVAKAANDMQGGMGAAIFQSYVSQESFTDAIDTQRPVGLFLVPQEKKEPMPILVVPVKDVEKALKLVPPGFEKKMVEENVWTLTNMPKEGDSRPSLVCNVYLKKDGWCFVTHQANDEVKNSDGAKFIEILGKEAVKNDFRIALFVNAIPQADRERAFNEAMNHITKKLDCKKRCMGEKLYSFFSAELKKLAESAEKNAYESPISCVALGYTWDNDVQKLVITNAFTGCTEKHQIKNLSRIVKGGETSLATFGTTDSFISAQVNASIAELNDPIVGQLLDMRRERIREHIEKHRGKEVADEICGYFEKNASLFRNAFLNPETEKAGAVFVSENALTLVGAHIVPDGYALEKEFQTAIKYMEIKKAKEVEKHVLNAKRTEVGALHIYQAEFVPKKGCLKDFGNIFDGKVPGCIIFAPNAVYTALGTDAVGVLQKCITSDVKKSDAPSFSARVSLEKLVCVLKMKGEVKPEVYEKLAKLNDVDLTMRIESLEDGMQFVTEIPAAFFQAMVIGRDNK